ncbi:MAG: tetraacyldisaccharide 4'-kinase [Bacteroidales bacterium]|nr:tetraacyldisaccharide 4'-kinase [Bacteroidales bacterium]MDE6801170.1 tetraacyldisaccharide 4'-kinase [Muribaculaceae bacterium]
MARNKIIETLFLLPMSKVYGLITSVRNSMFNCGLLKQRSFDVPVIVVGNIAVGGSGKTPHTEFIIDKLKNTYNIGVLSRGYKRKTKGFIIADQSSTPLTIGDEPFQIYKKFGQDVTVAVCEDRCKGIEKMLEENPDINLVVLDDAFQHRYVKPSVSIVLTEFNRPIFTDAMLPYGRLRESSRAVYRADMVIVTKCPKSLKPVEYRIFKNHLALYPYQKLYFSRFSYGNLKPVFPEVTNKVPYLEYLSEQDRILVVAGIANPRPFVKYIKSFKPLVKVNVFSDHHNFSKKDISLITKRFKEIKATYKFIVTTEKDAVRLANNSHFPDELKQYVYYLPINVSFDNESGDKFVADLNKLIIQSRKTC